MIFRKRRGPTAYDRQRWEPVLRCSICTGEQVAGFMDRVSGEFREDTLIANDAQLREFMERYGLKELRKVY